MTNLMDSRFSFYVRQDDLDSFRKAATLDPDLVRIPAGQRLSEFIRRACHHYAGHLKSQAARYGAPSVPDYPGVTQASREALEALREEGAEKVNSGQIRRWIESHYEIKIHTPNLSGISRMLSNHEGLEEVPGEIGGLRGTAKVYRFRGLPDGA